jgi:hypothetical protein
MGAEASGIGPDTQPDIPAIPHDPPGLAPVAARPYSFPLDMLPKRSLMRCMSWSRIAR